VPSNSPNPGDGKSLPLEGAAMPKPLTCDEILALPTMIDLTAACAALGIGRTAGYTHARNGTFPCRVIRVGRRYRVPTADLHVILGLAPPASGPSSVPTT